MTAKTRVLAAKAYGQWKSQATRAKSLANEGAHGVIFTGSYLPVDTLDGDKPGGGRKDSTVPDQLTLDFTATEAWTAGARRTASSKGQAMSGGRFPIRDRRDVQKAIRAVGRAKGSHGAVRAHIIRRARALGATDLIPDSWKAGGSGKAADLATATGGGVAVDSAVDLAWSDAARAAALEARRGKYKGRPHVSSHQTDPTKRAPRRRKLSGEEIEAMSTAALEARLKSGLAPENERQQLEDAIATRAAGHNATQREPGRGGGNVVVGSGAMTLQNLQGLASSGKLSPETTEKLRAIIKRLRKQRGGRITTGPSQLRTGRSAA